MKSKALLPLMEQLTMVLVFALTAALCLQGLTLADRISRRQEDQKQAVIMVQNAAEMLKHTSGDFVQSAGQLGGQWDGLGWNIPYDASWQPLADSGNAVYLLNAVPVETDNPFLGSARIRVLREEEILFEITVSWQEVNVDEDV